MIRDSGFLRQHRAFRLPQRHLRPETRPVLRRAATVGAFCGERWCLHHGEDGKFSAKEMAHFLTEDWFAWSSLPRQFLGIPYNAKAGCHVPLNLNQLDDGYLILKDDEVFCGSDWVPLLKSETMIGDNKMKTEYEQPTQFVVATSCPVLPVRPARVLCRLQPGTIAARRRHRPTRCQALFPQGQGHLRGQERRHRQHR